jgi:hypothetical protein
MEKYISKQWSVNARDFIKSLFYGAAVPVLVELQNFLANGDLENIDWKLLLKIAVGAIVAHIIRKLTEPTKEVQITKLSEHGGTNDFTNGGDRTNPPPMGDPTHPKK